MSDASSLIGRKYMYGIVTGEASKIYTAPLRGDEDDDNDAATTDIYLRTYYVRYLFAKCIQLQCVTAKHTSARGDTSLYIESRTVRATFYATRDLLVKLCLCSNYACNTVVLFTVMSSRYATSINNIL